MKRTGISALTEVALSTRLLWTACLSLCPHCIRMLEQPTRTRIWNDKSFSMVRPYFEGYRVGLLGTRIQTHKGFVLLHGEGYSQCLTCEHLISTVS